MTTFNPSTTIIPFITSSDVAVPETEPELDVTTSVGNAVPEAEPEIDAAVPEIDVAFVTIGIVLTLITFCGNLGTIVAFCTDRRVHSKPSDFMILGLACADFGIACFVMPMRLVILNILHRWPLGEIGCRFQVFIEMTFLTAGIMFVILISFDRYQMLALDYTDYIKKWTNKQVAKIIALTWLISLLPGIFEIITWDVTLAAIAEELRPNFDNTCSNPSSWRIVTNIICIVCVAVVPTTTVSLLGVFIILKLHRRLKQWRKVGVTINKPSSVPVTGPDISTAAVDSTTGNAVTKSSLDNSQGHEGTMKQPHNDGEDTTTSSLHKPTPVSNPSSADSKPKAKQNGKSNTQSSESIHNRYIKPVITYMCLVLCITICNFPICIYALLLSSTCPQCYNATLISALVSLMYCSSCINPLMYALTNAKIRGFYARQYGYIVKKFR